MSEFGPQIAEQVHAACQAGLGETQEALSRALDASIEVAVETAAVFEPENLTAGPGLAVVLVVGDEAAVFALSEATGLLPDWYQAPDATGTSKLMTLAQELGMLLLPEEHMPMDFQAGAVPDLAQALARSQPASGAGLVPLTLSAGDKSGVAQLIWPVGKPGAVLAAESAAAAEAEVQPEPPAETETRDPEPPPAAVPSRPPARSNAGSRKVHPADANQLPPYSQSLLRIAVPVSVTLASKKQTLAEVVEIGQGSLLQFDKACEELLQLEVAGRVIAEGEAVKVGDKFGIRISNVVLPDEKFSPVRGD